MYFVMNCVMSKLNTVKKGRASYGFTFSEILAVTVGGVSLISPAQVNSASINVAPSLFQRGLRRPTLDFLVHD